MEATDKLYHAEPNDQIAGLFVSFCLASVVKAEFRILEQTKYLVLHRYCETDIIPAV